VALTLRGVSKAVQDGRNGRYLLVALVRHVALSAPEVQGLIWKDNYQYGAPG